jgi:hypothetical protein
MQRKEAIKPPSKNNSSTVSKEERVQLLQKNRNELKKAFLEAEKELNGELNYDKVIPKLAKKLKVDEEDLRTAFKGSKGELVERFNSRSSIKDELVTTTVLTSSFGAITGFLTYLLCLYPEPLGVLVTGAFGGLTGALALATKKFSKQKKEIDSGLKEKVLEFKQNPRLPAPK